MATTLSYSNADFIPFTVIKSADVNAKFNDIKNRLNWDGSGTTTGLGDDNIQSNTVSGGGLTRATKLKAGTANYAVYNDANGKLTEAASLPSTAGGLGFVPTLSAGNAGKVVGVNDAGSSLELRSPESATIIEQFAGTVVTLTAGEAITALNAVCLALNEGAYKVFKADADAGDRKENYCGVALANASVTAQITTLTKATSWTTGSVTITVNGRNYTQAFSVDNDTSMQALATQLSADQDVQSAAASGSPNNVITVTGKGALTLTISDSASGGPDFTIVNTQSPVGGSVRVQMFGPLDGFTSLTVGNLYYVSTTAGSVTDAPTDASPVFVGQALSSTVLMISPNRFNYTFGQSTIFVRTHGSSDSTAANGTQTAEHFNFSSWGTGTASSAGIQLYSNGGDSAYTSKSHALDGVNSSGSVAGLFQSYNKTSWSTLTNRGTAKSRGSAFAFNGFLYGVKGMTNHSSNATVTTASDKWNGSAWSAGTAFSNARANTMTFVIGSLLHAVAGFTSGGSDGTDHETVSTADAVSTDTAPPAAGRSSSGAKAPSSSGWAILNSAGNTTTYAYNGSSWTGVITAAYTQFGDGAMHGFSTGQNKSITNAGISNSSGLSGGGSALSSTQTYNGSSIASSTASSTSRAWGYSAVI